jgi:hypothetical protein
VSRKSLYSDTDKVVFSNTIHRAMRFFLLDIFSDSSTSLAALFPWHAACALIEEDRKKEAPP